jgi:hypothetical protein
MGQYQSFHIQKVCFWFSCRTLLLWEAKLSYPKEFTLVQLQFMRLPTTEGEKLDHGAPLRLVNRGAQASGRLSVRPPKKEQTLEYWSTLKTYLDTLETVLVELKPIVEKVAKQNTVIVMVCNHGQSELLMNYVCSARARNLDLSPVLVFATDEETKDLAEGLGLAAFYDKTVCHERESLLSSNGSSTQCINQHSFYFEMSMLRTMEMLQRRLQGCMAIKHSRQ